ncbi:MULTISPECIES: HAD domain-containing protein [Pseudomonas]|uniref:HAD domain-containing protein n=1 Tax=Pseudomonas TaxID=286 RepID=UPI001EEA6782|nr:MULTISPECIES: HAD domain-containing protein [Pseudomonas]MCJ2374016.1 HAD domain-containing protein [Pseudomonas sp. RGM 3321]
MLTAKHHVLFLDFDGVLHPDAVYLSSSGPILRNEGELFMWAPNLENVLEQFPSVSLVLSTSWVRRLGFKRAKNYLSTALSSRVVGATWHSSMAKAWADDDPWDGRSRYEQISRYASRCHLRSWISIDDDAEGWPAVAGHHLILCDSNKGLGEASTLHALEKRLAEVVSDA